METERNPIEALVEKVEQFSKSTIELYWLKAVDRGADLISSMVARIVVLVFVVLFFLILNIGAALWLGDILGKSYYGFFAVAGFHAILALFFYLVRNRWIKKSVRNSIIVQALNN